MCLKNLALLARRCIPSSWTTYAHDAARTSVAKADCPGVLTPLWIFKPKAAPGRKGRVDHVVAHDGDVFVAGVLGESTVAYRLEASTGKQTWKFDSRTDIHQGHWPTMALGHVVLQDDGLFVLDSATGKKRFDRGMDWWGQTLADDERLYLVNTWHIHGPRLFVGAFDATMNPVWKHNELGHVPEDYQDQLGAIALDQGVLFQARVLRYGGSSGLFAFDARTGDALWHASTLPVSAISASQGRLYVIERDEPNSLRLVARSQLSGEKTWETQVQGTDYQAPAFAGDWVLTYDPGNGVTAWGASSGELGWVFPTKAHGLGDTTHFATHIAVAALSRTVIVTSGPKIYTIRSANGAMTWEGPAPGDKVDSGNVDGGKVDGGKVDGVHSPILAGGRVYVVRGGTLYALRCDGRAAVRP